MFNDNIALLSAIELESLDVQGVTVHIKYISGYVELAVLLCVGVGFLSLWFVFQSVPNGNLRHGYLAIRICRSGTGSVGDRKPKHNLPFS